MLYDPHVRLPSPALVVALIALFIALGGTSYAVTQLPKNSVGTKQLKKNSVTSAKINDGTIVTADLSAAARLALAGATGAQGPAGPQGPAGAAATTPSAYATRTSTDGLGGSWTTALALSQAGEASGPITVARPSRLSITASVTVFGSSVTDHSGAVACRALVTAAGQPVAQEGAANGWGSVPSVMDGGAFDDIFQSIPFVASAAVEAGTYDVAIECQPTAFVIATMVDRHLVVTALAG